MNYQSILHQYWGYDDFRGIQREIIESIGAGRDTLGLMPTGGGKSITFQVPALAMPGVCIVITPLISLMKDQVDHLRELGITAYAIHSGLAHGEVVKILDNCIYGDIKFLYVSPERLDSEFFLTKLRHIHVSFVTVDEAHCISQWGYDFRPSYLRISELRRHLPGKAILALTATATPEVVDDIQKQLAFKEKNVFRMSFVRDNLTYIGRETDDTIGEIIHILNRVSGSAIVYTMSRRKTREISKILNEEGISASFYHAGLDIAVKTKRQADWQQGLTRVIVATNAFGMGIDKPDVRIVIHADVPTSIEAYFQEAGRAGRDGKRSYAVLLHGHNTVKTLRQRVTQSFPTPDFIRAVYEHLAYFYEIGIGMGRDHTFLFSLEKFCLLNKYSPFLVDSALKILDNAGYIKYNTDDDSKSRIMFTTSRDQLYLLRDLPDELDRLILILLRNYTGLFTTYNSIDVAGIAAEMYPEEEKMGGELRGTEGGLRGAGNVGSGQSGVGSRQVKSKKAERVYMLLSDLQRRNIIRYIPPRTDPTITYLVDRVEEHEVILSDAVYSSLKGVMDRHVDAMIGYIQNSEVCRQQQLVRYFGESDSAECGTCEVCISNRRMSRNNEPEDQKKRDTLKSKLLDIISDHKPHLIRSLCETSEYSKQEILDSIDQLIDNGIASSDSLYITLNY